MHYSSIRQHLKPYLIVARRRTTIHHAFAAAIAPNDYYDADRVREAMLALGQDPDGELECAYCGVPAQTWDHVFATVKAGGFSGHGHRLGNLLPCCKACNSAKGNKHWEQYLEVIGGTDRADRIGAYLARYSVADSPLQSSAAYTRFLEIRQEVMALLAEADSLAKTIRDATE